MSSILDIQIQSVLERPEAYDFNIPGSHRTYADVLTDPEATTPDLLEVVDRFRTEHVDAPSAAISEDDQDALLWLPPEVGTLTSQVVSPLGEKDPARARFGTPGAPPGGLGPGEFVDSGDGLGYSYELERTQSIPLTINFGSLANGKRVDGKFLPGKPRPGSQSITINLPPGMRPDEIPEHYWDKILTFARGKFPVEMKKAREFQSLLEVSTKGVAREAVSLIPAIADMPYLAARGLDWIFSPVGTNTLYQTTKEALKPLGDAAGLPPATTSYLFDPPKPSGEVFQKYYPRLGERIGLYPTIMPGSVWSQLTGTKPIIEPGRELATIHHDFGKLLDGVLQNMDMPHLLTGEVETEAQEIADLIGKVMGGSLGFSGVTKASAMLAVRGMTAQQLRQKGKLQQALYGIANSPEITYLKGGERKFTIPGGLVYGAKDLLISGTAVGAMIMAPETWGESGKLLAGLAAPLSLGAVRSLVQKATGGADIPIIGGFLEAFSLGGQKRLAGRFMAETPGIRENPRLFVTLMENLDDVPKKAGQDELVTTPAYFNTVSDELRLAEETWASLRKQNVPEAQIIEQLSQNPVYGKYFNEIPIFEGLPGEVTLEKLAQIRAGTKAISDGLFGAMHWLASGSPIGNEVLRSAGERLRTAEEVWKDFGAKIAGDPADTATYVQEAVTKLDDLITQALGDHSADALLYKRLLELAEDSDLVAQNRMATGERGIQALQNAYRETREIESALWKYLGADQVSIAPENMRLIGDKAAEIILATPAAQRDQIPALIYRLSGTRRLMSEEKLAELAKGTGVDASVPKSIISLRAKIEALEKGRETKLLPTVAEDALLAQQQKIVDESTATIDAAMARSPDWYASGRGHSRGSAAETAEIARDKALKKIEGVQNKISQRSLEFDSKIEMERTRLASYERQLLPTHTDEAVAPPPNGILDDVDTLEEVTATRGVLLEVADKARAKNALNSSRLANDMQRYIVDEWLQNPDLFGTMPAETRAAYDMARTFSKDLNDRFTRGVVGELLSTDPGRELSGTATQALQKIVADSIQTDRRVPSGSVSEFEAALVEAKAPFIQRVGEDWVVDPDASLTPGIEGITWERILTDDNVPLSSELLREELFNRLALVAFDRTGYVKPQAIESFLNTLTVPIARVAEDFPDFRQEIQALATNGEALAVRHKALLNPTKRSMDEALISGDLDKLKPTIQAGIIARRAQADYTVTRSILDVDPHVLADSLLKEPNKLQTDIDTILQMLNKDDTGRALAGFRQAFWDELSRSIRSSPEKALRMPGEQPLDPGAIGKVLTEHEPALRKIFSDNLGRMPDGTPITTYDMLRMYGDEIAIAAADVAGTAAGARPRDITVNVDWKAAEFIRNAGRIVGVKAAGWTGGPALVMAGAGGRAANRLWEMGGVDAVHRFLGEAIVDPALARELLVDTTRLSKKGRFIFDKRINNAVAPFLYLDYPGTPAMLGKEALQQEIERERLLREGGPDEIILDPETNRYERVPSRRRKAPSETTPAPSRPISPASILSRTGLPFAHPLLQTPPPPVPAPTPHPFLQTPQASTPQGQASTPQGQINPQTMAGLRDLGIPLFANKGGIVSLPCKPRQLVG